MAKYISIEKLGLYDGKIKQHIADADTQVLADAKAFASELGDNYEAAGNVATAKEELQGKIDAVQVVADQAKGAADANAEAIENLDARVGDIPIGSDGTAVASSVIAYIDQKTEHIASDTAIAQIQSDLDVAEAAIDAIEADYLKKTDKDELSAAITAEADRAKGVEGGLETRLKAVEDDYLKASDKAELAGDIAENASAIAAVKEDVDAFFKDALGDTDAQQVKDTLKEIQEYIETDTSGAAAMAASIKANEDAISAEAAKVKTLQEEMDVVEKGVSDNAAAIASLQGAVGEGDSVDKKIEDAVAAETEARNTAIAEVQAAADAAQGTANEAKDAAATNATAIEGLQTAVNGKASSADLANLTSRVAEAEGKITTAEGEIDTLQSKMDAVEAKAAANETAISTLNTSVAGKADQSALEEEVARAKAAEAANKALIDAFVEASEEDINNLFKTA